MVARNAAGPSDLSYTRYFEVIEGTIIGTGDNTQVEPFNAWYGFGRSVSLYTYAQVGLSDFITDIGWSVAQPGNAPIPYKIWARTTPATSLDTMNWTWADFTSGATLVKEGTYTFDSTGWHIFELDIPFWIGTSNLLIGVETNYEGTGAGSGNYPRFHYTSFSPDRHLRWRADHNPPSGTGYSNQYLPNVYLLSSPRISNYPYFEGFETGQVDKNRLQGWRQVLDGGKTRYWKTNSSMSSHNRTPRNGDFNATLQWNGNAWLMKPFWFEETGFYEIELWARQDGSNPDDASIEIKFGSNATVAAMTNTIKAPTGLVNGDYQRISGRFYIDTPGTYWLGIHGVINSIPYYISLDDITVQQSQGLGFAVGYDTTYNAHYEYPAVYGGYYKNAREQYLITADEMPWVAAQMMLRNICFTVENLNGCGPLDNFTIKVGSTDATEFENNTFFDDLTEVYSVASYQPGAGQNYHDLTTPYYWDGVSSLVIQVSFGMNTGWTSNTGTYYSSTEPAYRTMYYRSDSIDWNTVSEGTLSNKRPNMAFQFTTPVVGPATAPILLYPADNAVDLPQAGFELTWRPDMNMGGAPSSYTVYLATDPAEIYTQHNWTTTATSLNPALQDGVNLVFGQQYYWTVKAGNDYGEAVAAPRSFTIEATPSYLTCPWTEDFDSVAEGDMPTGWTVIASHSGSDYRGWEASPYHGASSYPNAAVVGYHSAYPKDEWMITPPISMEAGHTYVIGFKVEAPGWEDVPEAMAVHWGTASTVAAMTANPALYDNEQITYSDWTEEHLLFTAPNTGLYHFGWHAKSQADVLYLAVDDIHIFEMLAVDLAAVGIGGGSLGKVGSTINHQVTVSNPGTTAQSSYTIHLKEQSSGTVLAQRQITETINSLESKVYTVSWTPTTPGVRDVYAEVVLAADQDGSNNATPAMRVTVYPANTPFLPIGATEGLNAVTYAPFDAFYEAFVAETVYLASEIQVSAGAIQAITYYNYFGTAWDFPNVQIWMQNTNAANVADGWLPWAGYELVYDGPLSCLAGTNEITIQLGTSFNYTGGNLAIRTTKTYQSDYVYGNCWLATSDANYPSRTRYCRTTSDGVINPSSPTGGYVENLVPNITLVMNPATLVTSLAAPVVDLTLSGTDAVLNWELVPYAYNYKVYLSEAPYAFGDEPVATVYTNTATVAATAGKCFYKVVAESYRDYPVRSQDMLSTLLQGSITVVETENPIEKARKDGSRRRYKP